MYGFKIIPQESFAVKLCPFITEYSGTAEGQNILWITLVTNWARAQSPPRSVVPLFHIIFTISYKLNGFMTNIFYHAYLIHENFCSMYVAKDFFTKTNER